MKTGILTFPNSVSYGATLQMYALYRVLEKCGCDVEVINYHNAYMKAEKHMKKASPRGKLKLMMKKALHLRLYSSFESFEKRMKRYPETAFSEKDKLPFVGKRYSAVICGSDQVWNPDITDSDLSFFLDFCTDSTRRISYAPSFGVESLPEKLASAAGRELRRFHAVSVREESGRDLVSAMTGRNEPLVADPTLLLAEEDWAAVEKPHPEAKGDYILYYTVHSSASLMRSARSLAEKTGMKLVVVGGNFIKKLKNRDKSVRYAADVSPEEWLYLMRRARYVVTNSFHGSAFAVNFRRDLYVELSSNTNTRLTNLLRTFSLEDRIIKDGESIAPSAADFSSADERLPVLRRTSREFLENALEVTP